MTTIRVGAVAGGMMVAALLWPGTAGAQETRLMGRLPDSARAAVERVLADATASGLPTEPLVDRALEGAAKSAPPDLIVRAVERLAGELETARLAFGDSATAGELTAGASALRAGAGREDLEQLRVLRGTQPLTVAASVLADLVAVGVPKDTAVAAVLALAPGLPDREYVAFRQNVERDIAQGASPAAALGVRLRVAADLAASPTGENTAQNGGSTPPRKRKP